jgi:DNA topoisomerase IA
LANFGELLKGRSSVGVRKGEPVELGQVKIEQQRTEAPAHFDEASLITLMAKNNIGTEATRVDAINSLARDKVADSLTQVDDYANNLGLPNVIKPTNWGKWLHSALPPTVTSQHMVVHVSAATEAARRGDFNPDQHLIIATQWLLKAI